MPKTIINISYLVLFIVLQELALADPLKDPEVVFINPGHAHESFWQDVDLFMLEAAKQLHISLTIKHAERNHLKMIQFAKELSQSKTPPDYLILVNEKQAAPSMLKQLENTGINVFMLLNDVPVQEKQALLLNPYWQQHYLGSLIPDNHYIGFETAKALFKAGNGLKSTSSDKILIISGDKSTPASQQREAGAHEYIKKSPQLKLVQTIYGHWQELRTKQQMDVLFKRYPDLKYIWTANDLMAFGAIKSAKENGLVPGENVYLSTVNTSQKVLELRQKNSISALGGGHFSAGGWALVLLKDHFNKFTIPELSSHKLFQLIKDDEIINLLKAKKWHKINFKQYSKTFNSDVSQYEFTLE